MDVDQEIEIITRGTAEVINLDGLKKKLAESRKKKKPLRVKAGFDPTAPDIHLGHVVLLRKLRQFQDLGHVVYFIVGDFTARIGDPSGRDQLRPKLSQKEINQNAKTYQKQAFKILDAKKTKTVANSGWLDKLSSQEILELTKYSTVAQMLARSDFKKRYDEGKEISILEFIYPLLQAYDSIEIKADIEFGGTDQKFNLLMGRQLQEAFDKEPQVVIMTPLLEGTDGIQKMSKTYGNYIGITEEPKEIFGKVMSISDEMMMKYYETLTDFDLEDIRATHPRDAKLRLAEDIVRQFHGTKKAGKARENFEKTFSEQKTPDDVPEYHLKKEGESVVDILTAAGIAQSRNEVRRLIRQGAVKHEGTPVTSEEWTPRKGVLKVGKHRFLRLL